MGSDDMDIANEPHVIIHTGTGNKVPYNFDTKPEAQRWLDGYGVSQTYKDQNYRIMSRMEWERRHSTLHRPTGPGNFLTREGALATVTGQDEQGNWKGFIIGYFTSTWWTHRGAHNTFPNHDLIGEAQCG